MRFRRSFVPIIALAVLATGCQTNLQTAWVIRKNVNDTAARAGEMHKAGEISNDSFEKFLNAYEATLKICDRLDTAAIEKIPLDWPFALFAARQAWDGLLRDLALERIQRAPPTTR